MRLASKKALVTGGGTGIGRSIAQRFAAEGAKVAVNGRRAEPLQETVEAIRAAGGEALAITGDLALPEQAEAMVQQTIAAFGGIDILVNNAGNVHRSKAGETSLEDWDRIMDLNIRAVFVTCRAAIRHMERNGGGSIVNTASISALRGQPSAASYCASKAAVINFTKSIANDYGHAAIRANCVLPALIETELSRTRLEEGEDWDERVARQYLDKYPLGRIGKPEDIANAALFLASEEASWITGIDLIVDGGHLARP